MKEFSELGYDATRAELDDNHDAVNMLSKKELTSDIYYNALSYLMFLRRKGIEKSRQYGVATVDTQGIYIQRRIKFTYCINICIDDIMRYGRNRR